MAELPRLRLMVPPVDTGTELRRPPEPRRGPRTGRIVSVGSGKGGVGKSLVAASLGIDLARRCARVVLVDCDLGGANLHTCLGIGPPRRTLSEFVNHEVERIEDVGVPTGIPNLSLVSGALDRLDTANPNDGQKMRFLPTGARSRSRSRLPTRRTSTPKARPGFPTAPPVSKGG